MSGNSTGSSRLACNSTTHSVLRDRRKPPQPRITLPLSREGRHGLACGQPWSGVPGSALLSRQFHPPLRHRLAASHAPGQRPQAPPARPALAASPRYGHQRRLPRSPPPPIGTDRAMPHQPAAAPQPPKSRPPAGRRSCGTGNGSGCAPAAALSPRSRRRAAAAPPDPRLTKSGSACAMIASAIASASVITAVSADSRVSSMRARTPRTSRDGPSMRI